MPAGDRTAAARRSTGPATSRAPATSTGAPTSSTTPEDSDAIRLAAPERIAEVAARAGIGDGTTVVIYDDTQGLYAARVWWTLRAYGLE